MFIAADQVDTMSQEGGCSTLIGSFSRPTISLSNPTCPAGSIFSFLSLPASTFTQPFQQGQLDSAQVLVPHPAGDLPAEINIFFTPKDKNITKDANEDIK